MAQDQHNLKKNDLDPFMYRNRLSGLQDYIQGASKDIMSLLKGVEVELESRRRLKRHNVRDYAANEHEEVIEDVLQEPERKTANRCTGKNHPRPDNFDTYLNEVKPDVSLTEGNCYNNHNKDMPTSKIETPSLNFETEMQLKPERQKKIKHIWKNVDGKDWNDSFSYVDFSSSHPEVKWHKGSKDFIPKNSCPIGYTKLGKPLYAGRTWDEERSYLVPAFVDVEGGACFYGKNEELMSSNIYEIMECKFVAWDDAKGTPVTELSRFAYKAGYNEKDEPLYFGRAFIDGALTPGYIEERYFEGAPNNLAFALILPFRGNVLCIFDTYEVMIVIPNDRD